MPVVIRIVSGRTRYDFLFVFHCKLPYLVSFPRKAIFIPSFYLTTPGENGCDYFRVLLQLSQISGVLSGVTRFWKESSVYAQYARALQTYIATDLNSRAFTSLRKGPFIATQLNSTSSRVELSCVSVAVDTSPTQLNSTRRRVDLCRYKRA